MIQFLVHFQIESFAAENLTQLDRRLNGIELLSLMDTSHHPATDGFLSEREQRLVVALFFLVGTLTGLDILEDLREGVLPTHLVIEISIASSTLIGGTLLWMRISNRWQRVHSKLSKDLVRASEDLTKWRESTHALYAGLSEAIVIQFKNWGLSEAESDVALLLLKGLSHKEIANLRNTSERTVRQQAAAVYGKSQLDGRAQLSAFFLEDLLAGKSPPTN